MRLYYAFWVDEYREYDIFKIGVEHNQHVPFGIHFLIWRLNIAFGLERA